MWESHINPYNKKESVLCIEVTKIGVSFVNFARIASICVGFHLGTLHGCLFHYDFWPNLNFPLEYQIKPVLKVPNIPRKTHI